MFSLPVYSYHTSHAQFILQFLFDITSGASVPPVALALPAMSPVPEGWRSLLEAWSRGVDGWQLIDDS